MPRPTIQERARRALIDALSVGWSCADLAMDAATSNLALSGVEPDDARRAVIAAWRDMQATEPN